MSDSSIQVDRGASMTADLAFMETEGPDAHRVRAALWAYEWAKVTAAKTGLYPSLNDLRAALAAWEHKR
jgi:hypothetical protein